MQISKEPKELSAFYIIFKGLSIARNVSDPVVAL